MLVILILIIATLIIAYLQRKTLWLSKGWVKGISFLGTAFLLLAIFSLFPKLMYLNERVPFHTDWELEETIQNDSSIIFLYQKEGSEGNVYDDILVFQKIAVFTLINPGDSVSKFQIYQYDGNDNTYQNNKAQTEAYDVGNETYLIYLKLYDGQTLDVSDITYGGEAVEFQVSETDPMMIFFISNLQSADLTVNNLSFQILWD